MASIDKTMLPDSLLAAQQQLGNNLQIQPQAAHSTPKTSTSTHICFVQSISAAARTHTLFSCPKKAKKQKKYFFIFFSRTQIVFVVKDFFSLFFFSPRCAVFRSMPSDIESITFLVNAEKNLKQTCAQLDEQCRVLKQANAVLQAQLRGANAEAERRVGALQAEMQQTAASYERRIRELEAQLVEQGESRKRSFTGGKSFLSSVSAYAQAQAEAAAAATLHEVEEEDEEEERHHTGGKTVPGYMMSAASGYMRQQEQLAAEQEEQERQFIGNKHLPGYGFVARDDEDSSSSSSDDEDSSSDDEVAEAVNFQPAHDLAYYRQSAVDSIFSQIVVDDVPEELPAAKSQRVVEIEDEIEELHNIHDVSDIDLGDKQALQQRALVEIQEEYEDYSAQVRFAVKLADRNMPIKSGSKKTRDHMAEWTCNSKVARVLVDGVDPQLRAMLADNGVEAISGSSRMPVSGPRIKADERACIVIVDSLEDGTPDMQDVVMQHAAMHLVLSGHPVMTLRRFVEELADFNVVNQVYDAGAPRDLRADFFARVKGKQNALYHWVTPATPCMFRVCTANSSEKQLMELMCRNLCTKKGASLVQHVSSSCAKTPAEICALVAKQFVAY
jgi:hypothetical protein